SHPNLVSIHDYGQDGPLGWLVMEYVDGSSLRDLIHAGKLEPPEALALIPKICDALQYAHDRGVVHRDVKPANILVGRDGVVKIADFGLAKLIGVPAALVSLTGSREVLGTFRYMAPEQLERPLEVDHRADIYSLGVVFYEMLTGEIPMGRFDPPSAHSAAAPEVDDVVL
ncbi:MAG: serine/threonine protein kinase, partial [bacterium]|nr:serine/threonine protein kinase [bacterium]